MVGVSFRKKFGSPGATTIESAERIGKRPVRNDARPAVQLAWPYQFVKVAPSFVILSTFGVGWPSVAPPFVYAPKSFQPVSSVMSMTILGDLSAACAGACIPTAVVTASPVNIVRRIFREAFIWTLLGLTSAWRI